MSLVFGETLVRGNLTEFDQGQLKLVVSLRTYSEDVRLAMADLSSGLDQFGSDVAERIEQAVPGLDLASLAFGAFTRSYDTSICAETYLPLQDLSGVRWIVFYDNSSGVLKTEGIHNEEELSERLERVGGYALFSVNVKDYHCNTSRPASMQQCQLATQLMKDWQGASVFGHEPSDSWDFVWEVDFSSEPDSLQASGKSMSTLAAQFKLDDHIGNYEKMTSTQIPKWKVLGAVWRSMNDLRCVEDVAGEVMYTNHADKGMVVGKVLLKNVKYDGFGLLHTTSTRRASLPESENDSIANGTMSLYTATRKRGLQLIALHGVRRKQSER